MGNVNLNLRHSSDQSLTAEHISHISINSRTSRALGATSDALKSGAHGAATAGKASVRGLATAGKVGLQGAAIAGKTAHRIGKPVAHELKDTGQDFIQNLESEASMADAGSKTALDGVKRNLKKAATNAAMAPVTIASRNIGNRIGLAVENSIRSAFGVAQRNVKVGLTGNIRPSGRMFSKTGSKAAQAGATASKNVARRVAEMAVRATSRIIGHIVAAFAAKFSAVLLMIFVVCVTVILVLTIIFSWLPSWLTGQENEKPKGGSVTGVPSEYVGAVMRAGSICSEITPALIAAQLKQESGFNPDATSPVGAQGIAQFMPGTWASSGKDGDGDGIADPWNPQDAIWSQGNFMCDLVRQLEEDPSLRPLQDLALAAYNAGLGAVQDYNGIPPYEETQNYVATIKANMASFAATGSSAAEQSATDLVNGTPVDSSIFPPEEMSEPDPTPGAHGVARVTPRTYTMIMAVMAAYPQIVLPALYCWDAHTYNPRSEHPKGRACDIPFYSCTQVDARRSADPATGTEAGNAAANWLVQNAQSFGVYYVIWRGQIWYARTGTWEPYDGAGGLYNPSDCSGGHYDHIHVSMY